MIYKTISEAIIELREADLKLRGMLIQKGMLGDGYNREMEQLHIRNADILDGLIDEIGYPTIDKVGAEASEAAWLVIQHSISKPDFMEKCLGLLQEVVKDCRANPKNLAYLADRVAVFRGRKQLYGTQFDWDKMGQLSPKPYDNRTKVNQRRKSIGLNSLEEQTTLLRAQAKNENESPPKDFEKRKLKIDEWRRAVGWIK